MSQSVGEKVEKFFRKAKLLKFKKRELIIRSDDDELDYVFYLNKGYVKQYLITKLGDERTVNIFKKGTYFPIVLIMNEIKNHYSFEAMTEVEVYRRKKVDVLIFMQKNNDVLFDLTARLGRGIEGMSVLRSYSAGHSARIKIAAVIQTCFKRFGKAYEEGKILIKLPLLHKDLAAIAGLTRESISREIEKLEKEKIIQRSDKHYIVNNRSALEQILL